MSIDKIRFDREYEPVSYGNKGWHSCEKLMCPDCQKDGKFGIIFKNDDGVVHCFRCDFSTSLSIYLKSLGRDDLVTKEASYSKELGILEPEFGISGVDLEELPEVSLPKGYERVNYDRYLHGRNFKSYQYDLFEVGKTDHFMEKKLKDCVIFVMKQNGRRVAWLSRSKKSKEWHEKNLEDFKEGKEYLKLRYYNSDDTDFSKILGGLDEITEKTHTVVAVEGLLDKTNTDNVFNTKISEGLKVVFTFGNKFSDDQVAILRQKKSVDTIILMYDYNTVKQSKKYSMALSKYYNVYVCLIEDEDIDPGNMSKEYALNLLKKMKTAMEFYSSVLSFKKID